MFLYSQKKKKTKKHFTDSVQSFLAALLDYVICLYIMLMLAVFPFYNEEGYAHIGTDKSTFFCRLSTNAGKILVVPLLLYLFLAFFVHLRDRTKADFRKKKIRDYVTPTDFFAAFYGIALLLSYVLTNFKEDALWGTKGWYMGLIPQLILVAIYFLISRLWCPRRWMLLLALPVSAVVFFLGCLNRFGIYPIEMAYAGPSFISTIGNINWYCGYAVSVVFLGSILLWTEPEKKVWQKIMLMIYTALGFVNLIIQGSESGLVALAVVLLVMLCCSVKDKERMLAFWQEMVLLSGGCLVVYVVRLFAPDEYLMNYLEGFGALLTYGWLPIAMTIVSVLGLVLVWKTKRKGSYPEKLLGILAKTAVFGCVGAVLAVLLLAAINTFRPGSLGRFSEYDLFTYNENWGSSRGATWAAGWRCFEGQDLLHKLTGVGPDCMSKYLYSGENPELLADVKEKFGAARLTNAHNEWLTVLVNTGIIGLIGFGGMMVSGMRDLLKKGLENPIVCACGFCLLAYTVNNIFSFQQSMSVGTIFVIFGIGEAFLRNGEKEV